MFPKNAVLRGSGEFSIVIKMYVMYSLLLFFTLAFAIPVYFVRLKLMRGEGLHLKERLGLKLPSLPKGAPTLWIHAVSVGEVLSLQNLITKIKQAHPDWMIYFSSLTNSGVRMAREKLDQVDGIVYAPFDIKWIATKFFRSFQPQVFVLAESEFWPNLLRVAATQTQGVLLINGRISSRSLRRYTKVKSLASRILRHVNLFLVQTDRDKESLQKIGVESTRIEVTGNLKTEINLPPLSEDEVSKLRRTLRIKETQRVIVAGSTRKGEEEKLLKAFARAKKRKKNILLVLAPRHIERAEEIEKICQEIRLKVERRTTFSDTAEWDVFVLDTLGELTKFYALADIAFVGGSLIPWGGHNLLEPAFYKKPVFFGPHMDNFSFLAQKFLDKGAARVIHPGDELENMFLLQNQEWLDDMGQKAKSTLDSLQGATDRTLEVIETLMQKPEWRTRG